MRIKEKKSPLLARWILKKFRNRADHESLLGDYEEIFNYYCAKDGRFKASCWYWLQVLKSVPTFLFNSFYWRTTMIKNYFKITLRNMIKQKGYSAINLFGLAIGMACCILILFWVSDELKGDRFHQQGERIYRVIISEKLHGRPTGYWRVTPAPLVNILKKNYPEVEDGVCFIKKDKVVVNLGNQSFRENDFIFADPSLFSIFTFKFISGDPLQALQDPQSIILTHTMAKKYFADTNPIGKSLKIEDKQDLIVSAIIEDLPANSHISGKCFANLKQIKLLNADITSWGEFGYSTYVLLKPDAQWQNLDKNIRGYLQTRDKENKITLHLQHFPRIYLYSRKDFGLTGSGDIRIVVLLSIVALLILLIACINFINLSTARATNRCKEIGLRKVVGGNRKDLIFQFFGESSMMAFIALFLALTVVGLLLPSFNQITGKQMDLDFIFSGTIFFGILIITLFTGLASGIYPALLLSSFHPVKVLTGQRDMGKRDSALRKILVVTQFSLSIVMIISTVVIYQQIQYMKTKNLGFDKEQLAYLYLSSNRASSFLTIKNELSGLSGILQITAASNPPFGGLPSTSGVDWQGKDPKKLVLFHFLTTDYDYLKTLKLKMASGRFFSRERITDKKDAYVVNEAAVKAMGITDPVGKTFSPNNPNGRVIGVIKDYNFKSLHNSVKPMYIRYRDDRMQYFILRLASGNSSATIASIKKIWDRILPGVPFEFGFVDAKLDTYYRVERRMSKLFIYAASLAVLISCLGLFGLASFTACQKKREIGIRKVLGAKVSSIVGQLSFDFSKWVLLANVVAWPSAYYFMKDMLQNYSYRVPLGVEIFIISGMLSLAIAFITVGYHALKAANTNPVNTIRNE